MLQDNNHGFDHACIHLANERFVGGVRTLRLQGQVLIFTFWLASQ